MMSFVIKKLLADAAVAAIVSRKVYPLVAPQRTQLPYVTCQVVSGVPTRCREGIVVKTTRVQVNAVAATYPEMESLFMAIETALEGATDGSITSKLLGYRDLQRDERAAQVKAIDFQLITN